MIGKRLKEIRKALRLNQSEMGKLLGASQRAVSHWERNQAEPSLEQIQKLITLFNINPNWLLTGEGEMFLTSKGGEYYNSPIGINSTIVNVGNIAGKNVIVKEKTKENKETKDIGEILKILEEIKTQNPKAYEKAVNKLISEARALKELLL